MARRPCLLTPTPDPSPQGGGEKQPNACAGHTLAALRMNHELRRLALVATAAAAVRFSTPSLA
jgi:hypothetical protein